MNTSVDTAPSAVDRAVADAAASGLQTTSRADRARWLRVLADALDADRATVVEIGHAETHLSEARLDGEVTRTVVQLRFFAGVIEEGSYLEATIDSADATVVPPRPALHRMLRPLGPVAVFTASNFPFAFSVLGNDTASALAAGCPVVVKAHPGHPGLSRRVAEVATRALQDAGAPAGMFSLVEGVAEGVELVKHPSITAVGFTGSLRGGRALFDIACARPAPIPFYGELGSLNPVVLTRAAVDSRAGAIADGLVGSFTRDGGQYCTKPGIVLVPEGTGFEAEVAARVPSAPAQRLLTAGIGDAYVRGSSALAGRDDVEVVAVGVAGDDDATPTVLAVSVDAFAAAHETFLTECFGPLTLLVRYADAAELDRAIAVLEGSLTGAIHCEPHEDVASLTERLSRIAGRVLFNGWPTGVAIAWGQQHGGPWPATTAAIHTSVGATAIRRWLTPLALQDAPESVLPAELAAGNPMRIPRREDGTLVVPSRLG